MGCHNGIHLKGDEDADPGPAAIAAGIARYAAQRAYDLILTGSISEDGMHGLVGPMVAGYLKRPCVTCAVEMALAENGAALRVE